MTTDPGMVFGAVVIGGGISGLAVAFALRCRAAELGMSFRAVVLERDNRPGGKIVTRREGGFVVEGGPDSFFNQKPEALELGRELGLENEFLPSNDATYSTRLLRGGRLLPYPPGFRLAVPTRLGPFLRTPLLSFRGKARMALDLLLPRRSGDADESLGDFIRRRLGREAAERLAGPLLGAIFVTDPARMSIRATLPMLPEIERRHRSLILGIRAARRQARHAAAPAMFTTLRGGLATLTERLADRLGPAVRTSSAAVSLERSGSGWRVRTADGGMVEGRLLVLATPARETARLIEPHHPLLAAAIRRIPHVSSATVSLAYRAGDLSGLSGGGGFGFVAPPDEPVDLLAFTWSSRKFADRAPPDHHLVRAFVGGPRHDEAARRPAAELLATARRELARILGIRAEPVAAWVHAWPDGNPQYEVGHLEHVAEIEAMAGTLPGLRLIGCAYRGVGIPDCIRAARRAAADLLPGV